MNCPYCGGTDQYHDVPARDYDNSEWTLLRRTHCENCGRYFVVRFVPAQIITEDGERDFPPSITPK